MRAERLAQHMTQEELAFNAGLNRNYVMAIEKGRRKVSIITIYSLAKGLGVSASTLLSRTDQLMR